MSRRAIAVIDVGAIERNTRRLRSRLEPATKLCAVVKANGYGHGATETARAALAGGATWLAVATATEAADLRQEFARVPILVLGPLDSEDLRVAIDADADIVAWSADFVRRAITRSEAQVVRLHLKLDTGMGRFGVRNLRTARNLVTLISEQTSTRLVGVMTHFATADESDNAFFSQQMKSFVEFVGEIRRSHQRVLVHAANSAATLRYPGSHFDMVRCGVALYGLDPFQRDPLSWELEPALALRSYVARVARIEPGESVGYGRTWRACVPTYVATVPMGYADGIRRSIDDPVSVLVAGERLSMIGMVSMDSFTVCLGSATGVKEGDEVVISGSSGLERIYVEELAHAHKTISHDIVCSIGCRVERSYFR